MISVLMPAKNAEDTIKLAVRSTLSALPLDGELLVADDRSSDSTLQTLREMSRTDARLRVFSGESDGGVANSLNFLLQEAKHSLVARMDADDVTLPWRFAFQSCQIGENADLVFSNRINFGAKIASFRPSSISAISQEAMPLWLAITNPVAHSSLLAKKSLLIEVGGYRTGPAEDYDLWMRLVCAGAKITRISVPCIGYRLHPNQITKGEDWRRSFIEDENLLTSHDSLMRWVGWNGPSVWNELHGKVHSSLQTEAAKDLQKYLSEKFVFHNRLVYKFHLARATHGS